MAPNKDILIDINTVTLTHKLIPRKNQALKTNQAKKVNSRTLTLPWCFYLKWNACMGAKKPKTEYVQELQDTRKYRKWNTTINRENSPKRKEKEKQRITRISETQKMEKENGATIINRLDSSLSLKSIQKWKR